MLRRTLKAQSQDQTVDKSRRGCDQFRNSSGVQFLFGGLSSPKSFRVSGSQFWAPKNGEQSDDLMLSMRQISHHSGILGPVHTGIAYLFQVLFAGVGSLAPTLRLRCRSGVFHHRAAQLRRPFRAVPSSSACSLLLLSSGCPFFPGSAAGHRSGSSPTYWSISFTLRRVFQVLWLRAWSSPTATSCLYYVASQYSGYASISSTSTSAAWWIPGSGKGQGRHGQAQSVHVARRREGIHRYASLRRATTQFL